ncbi:MAG: M48 family metalloprotease, partial [Myxococcota bacterium]
MHAPSGLTRFEDFVRFHAGAADRARTESVLRKGRLSPRLDAIARRLRAAEGLLIPVPDVPIRIAANAPLGAVAPGPVVLVSSHLDVTAPSTVLAFVIAHELAHVALRHVEIAPQPLRSLRRLGRWLRVGYQIELDADRLAYRWCRQAGLEGGAWEFFHTCRRELRKQGRGNDVREAILATPLEHWWEVHLRTHPPIDRRLRALREIDKDGENEAL